MTTPAMHDAPTLRTRRGYGRAWDLFGEIDVDNFAGGGGVGMGFELATGKAFEIAINHDPAAIEMHAINHPETRHLCESVWKVDPVEVCGGRPVRLAWFSPDCRHFSRAKGAKPVERKIRGLAWVAVRWAKRVRPRIIILENVREFQDWGPLTEENRPCPARKGVTFRRFVGTLRGLGYEVEWRVLNAADYGAPTHRRRLFLIARCDGRPIVWPERTHGSPMGPGRVGDRQAQRAHAGAEGDEASPLSAAQHASASANGAGSHAQPGRIQDPQGPRHGRSGGRLRPYRTAAECIDWSIPCPSIFDRKRPLAEKTLRRIAMGLRRYVLESPSPFIVRCAHGESAKGKAWGHKPIGIDEPLGTMTGTKDYALVSPTLVQTGYGEREGQAPRALDINAPLGTVVGGGQKHALVTAFLSQFFGGVVGKPVTDPVPTVTAVDHNGLAAAHLVKFRGDSKGTAADEPMPTITSGAGAARPAGAAHALGVSAAYLTKLRGMGGWKTADAPIDTICSGATTFAATAAYLVRNFHGQKQANGADEPLPTVTTQGNKFGLVYVFLTKYFGTGVGQGADEPLHTITGRDRFGVVMVEVEPGHAEPAVCVDVPGVGPCLIADIGLRMLTPRELARAQGFPDSYVLTGSKANQVAKIGNSVPPPIVAALVRANVQDAEAGRDVA